MPDRCKFGGDTKSNGNCSVPAPDDGLPVQCVGPWSRDKHDILRRYLYGSGGPRSRYLPPKGRGGAAYVDLFAGPGRSRVSTTGELVEGSPLIALKQPVPFTTVVLCEVDQENVETLRKRTAAATVPVKIVDGDCNVTVDRVVAQIPAYGLNVALVDPFHLGSLAFETIRRLGALRRMDLVLFFPVGEIKRNLERNRATYTEYLNRALGTDRWQQTVQTPDDVTRLIRVFRDALEPLGYSKENTYTHPIKNEKNVVLYHLLFASKHRRGDAIWESVTRRAPSGQRRLF
jgi:three-Cys-motif partner protein